MNLRTLGFSFALLCGSLILLYLTGLLQINLPPDKRNLDNECPSLASLAVAGYRVLGSGRIGADEYRRSLPRQWTLLTNVRGSWVAGYDPIGNGTNICVENSGSFFRLEVTGK